MLPTCCLVVLLRAGACRHAVRSGLLVCSVHLASGLHAAMQPVNFTCTCLEQHMHLVLISSSIERVQHT